MDLNLGRALAFLPQGPGKLCRVSRGVDPNLLLPGASTQRPSIQGVGNCGQRSQLRRATPGHELCDPAYVA